jgi:hypothetical protein
MTMDAVILTRNRPEQCLDTVRQTAAAWPSAVAGGIVVVNNGGIPPAIPASVAGVPCRLLSLPRNIGAAARNRILTGTEPADFLVMLDDDATLSQAAFADMARLFAADARTGAVAFRVSNGTREEGCLLPTVFHGCACGFRSRALQAIGGYPTGYLYYGEEYDVAFRLYAANWRIVLSNTLGHVVHRRASEGRDTRRILRLLIRNNAFLWAAALPRAVLGPALRDTLVRYWRIARKEKAVPGFIGGCRALPFALCRGFAHRRPLPNPIFRKIVLLDPLVGLCRALRARGVRRVTLCGVGKFPTLWRSAIRAEGLAVEAYWDGNTCWHEQTLSGIPVRVCDPAAETAPRFPSSADHAWIVGLASLGETAAWHARLSALGKKPCSPAGEPEIFSRSDTIIDLLANIPVRAYV